MKKLIACTIALVCLLLPIAAEASYKYAHAEAEYIIELPDAPTAETIWAQNKKVPYIDNPPKYGSVGEIASLKRVDPETGDFFDVKITFIKADRDFLLSLTEEKIKDALKKDFFDTLLNNSKFSFSKGSDTLKWGKLSGFSVSQNNSVLYNIEHYLAGQASIMVIRVSYSVENQAYNDYYKMLAKSITYIGQ